MIDSRELISIHHLGLFLLTFLYVLIKVIGSVLPVGFYLFLFCLAGFNVRFQLFTSFDAFLNLLVESDLYFNNGLIIILNERFILSTLLHLNVAVIRYLLSIFSAFVNLLIENNHFLLKSSYVLLENNFILLHCSIVSLMGP